MILHALQGCCQVMEDFTDAFAFVSCTQEHARTTSTLQLLAIAYLLRPLTFPIVQDLSNEETLLES